MFKVVGVSLLKNMAKYELDEPEVVDIPSDEGILDDDADLRSVDRGIGTPKKWTAVRQIKNFQGNHGVSDVNSQDMRCFQMRSGTTTASINAGGTLGFVANAQTTHFGPLSFYMARVPDSANINTWETSGDVWFKVASIDGVRASGGWTWPAFGSSFRSLISVCDAS